MAADALLGRTPLVDTLLGGNLQLEREEAARGRA
jgi:hypothetical protein